MNSVVNNDQRDCPERIRNRSMGLRLALCKSEPLISGPEMVSTSPRPLREYLTAIIDRRLGVSYCLMMNGHVNPKKTPLLIPFPESGRRHSGVKSAASVSTLNLVLS
ncbi:hypothetical protein CDEST_03197 [Colletotrichum destructivum]|uniref:Uncharacterized protein n=1 Tax=Colletotrichum destructivum TaxID=34406 RepID=A0AAX4I462_9PEZI|nr:hypothetical protein CDEST_03197 [Colletotrichum destructivum]